MKSKAIHECAVHKAFAKLTILGFELEDLKLDLKRGTIGTITIEEHERLIAGTEKRIQIWNYIAKLIETNE